MIDLRKISKSFGNVRAVEAVSLAIEDGEVIVIQGPSGSGKTTLLRLIAGLALPDDGEIFIDEVVVSTPSWASAPYLRGVGVVFQRSALWPHMTVAQNVRFPILQLSREVASERVREVLEAVRLQDLARRYPNQLSGGEARRVALARALVARPQRLLLDEPLTHIDPALKERLLGLIKDHTQEMGATLLYITHDESEAEEVGGRLYRMENGKVLG